MNVEVDRLLPWRAAASAEAAEDDAKTNRRMRKIFYALPAKRCSISNLGGKAAFSFDNALRTTRSTRRTAGGSVSPKTT